MQQTKLNAQEWSNIETRYLEFVEAFGLERADRFDVHAVRDRQGVFSFALTVWLLILQRFNPRHSLSGALEELTRGAAEQVLSKIERSKKVRNRKISSNSGGYSQARKKLSLTLVKELSESVFKKMTKIYGTQETGGQKVYLLDGTGMTVGNYDAVSRKYPRQGTQYGPQRYPYLRVVFAHNLANGMAVCPQHGTLRQSEQELCIGTLKELPKGSLVIADRNFGIYSVTYHAAIAGLHTLTRIRDDIAKKLLSSSNTDADERVIWKAPHKSNKGTHKALMNTEIEGRVIKRTVQRNGFRNLVLYFFTTSDLPTDKLVEVYLQRERIENDIRDIKHTLCLQVVASKSPDIIEKELLLGIMAYNLLRATIADVAQKIGLQPRQISFSRALGLIRVMHEKLMRARTFREVEAAQVWFFTAMRQIQIYKRKKPRPTQPRKVMGTRLSGFPVMKKSRKEEELAINLGLI
jgi:hypothetical protein